MGQVGWHRYENQQKSIQVYDMYSMQNHGVQLLRYLWMNKCMFCAFFVVFLSRQYIDILKFIVIFCKLIQKCVVSFLFF
jgi:hypothetical protein